MKRWQKIWRQYRAAAWWLSLILIGLGWLLLWQLGSLVGGLSASEFASTQQAVGWRGIWQDPFYLPLKLVRSVVFFLEPDHGQILSRLPNAIFGGLTMAGFGCLIWLWHGQRTAILTTLLFASSAWVLHTSRVASFEIMYLWGITALLLVQVALHRYADKTLAWYGSLLIWCLLIYIPGMVWFIGLQIYLQRANLLKAWRTFASDNQRLVSFTAIGLSLPLLIIHLFRDGQFIEWLGLPTDWPGPLLLLKQFVGVFVHLFVRGPQYPEQWLGRAPILDAFTLVTCVVGIYFYLQHWQSSRSRAIGLMFGLGVVLVALGGPVGLSVLIPLAYVAVAAGLTYLLREWLLVFPRNPLARGLGVGLVAVVVSISCLYNLRAYFIAWPHNTTTQTIFQRYL